MAFWHIRFPIQLANQRIASFGMDFETVVSLTGSEIQDLADTATTEWFTNVALFAVDAELQACSVQGQERVIIPATLTRPEHPARQPVTTEYVGSGSAAGTASGQSSSPGTSLVVTLRTANPGRRARGRVYTPPPPEAVIDGAGQVSDVASRVTMVQDLAAAVEGALTPVDVDHVVWSITYDEQNEVTQYTSNGIADYQRRRARQ